jgi:hypothetical protein
MEQRTYYRIQTGESVRIYYRNKIYPGTTLNLSQKGMFINTKRWFSSNSLCLIDIKIGDELLKFLSRVKQFTKINSDSYGVGVEILNPPQNYLEYVNSLKSLCKY